MIKKNEPSANQFTFIYIDQGVFSDDVNIAKTKVLRFDVRLASETSLSPLVVESNSLLVTQYVLGIYHIRSDFDHFLGTEANSSTTASDFDIF